MHRHRQEGIEGRPERLLLRADPLQLLRDVRKSSQGIQGQGIRLVFEVQRQAAKSLRRSVIEHLPLAEGLPEPGRCKGGLEVDGLVLSIENQTFKDKQTLADRHDGAQCDRLGTWGHDREKATSIRGLNERPSILKRHLHFGSGHRQVRLLDCLREQTTTTASLLQAARAIGHQGTFGVDENPCSGLLPNPSLDQNAPRPRIHGHGHRSGRGERCGILQKHDRAARRAIRPDAPADQKQKAHHRTESHDAYPLPQTLLSVHTP